MEMSAASGRLYRLLTQPARHGQFRAMLTDAQRAALCSVTWLPTSAGIALHLGFTDGCVLPRRLCGQGITLPVHAIRTPRLQLHRSIQLENVDCSSGTGTLTGIVRRAASAALYALSAGHVMGGSSGAQIGDQVTLRSDQADRCVSGKLDRWAPAFHAGSPDTYVDAGLARIPLQHARELLELGLDLPVGVATPALNNGMLLRTRDQSIAAEMIGYTAAWMNLGDGGATHDYCIIEGLAYQAASAPQAGDSGAPLWDAQERLVAMHIGAGAGGEAGNGLAVPVQRVLNLFGCELVDRASAAALGSAATASLPTLAATPAPPVSSAQITLARTLWGEARGEGRAGMEAVANVVLNRVRRQTWWGRTPSQVCCKPNQFSCWNSTDPNREKMLRADASDPAYALALVVAQAALANALADNTAGATHYHAGTLHPLPKWARGHVRCAQVGRHLFYNDID
ncbi:cell wall hydrolase [Massilia sp. CF038]|uniref:cell wall hydrolase n=1 Tax=Massilia sp. CF038 TaxID=1881045 RepID=UPI00091C92D3|nr:cell wall hydrolase [Massilia sp. CF038]SHH62836.1 Cell Wall Hydrolase [Massilia sp. CF038]